MMNTTLLPAIIGAIGTVLAALVTVIATHYLTKHNNNRPPEQHTTKTQKPGTPLEEPIQPHQTQTKKIRVSSAANTALWFALSAIFILFTALPAVIIARKALKEIDSSQGIIVGRKRAKFALYVGYFYCFLTIIAVIGAVLDNMG